MNLIMYNQILANGKIRLPLDLYVNRFSKKAYGGPHEASVSARGSIENLATLPHYLGSPAYILDPRTNKAWWGYLFGVEVRYGTRVVNASMGRLYNKVASYFVEPGAWGSQTRTTSWASDATSIARYGTREYLFAAGESSLDVAEAVRDQLLGLYRLPQLNTTSGAAEGAAYSALMTFKGWYTRLAWRYAPKSEGLEQNDPTNPEGVQHMGDNVGLQVCTTFQIGSTLGWSSHQVAIRLRKFGTPADNVRISIYTWTGSAPGTEQAYGTIAGTAVGEDYNWIEVTLNTDFTLAAGTTYALVIQRSGAQDVDNYYSVHVDEDLSYTRGAFKIYGGATWDARTPDADLVFRILGIEQTSSQISYFIDAYTDEWASGYTVSPASGLYSSPYRDGRATAEYCIRELLDAGVSDGSRYRLTIDQNLQVVVEPEPTAIEYYMDESNRLYIKPNNPIPQYVCPAGVWLAYRGIPPQFNSPVLSDNRKIFIDYAEYDCTADRLTLEPRGEGSPYQIVDLL